MIKKTRVYTPSGNPKWNEEMKNIYSIKLTRADLLIFLFLLTFLILFTVHTLLSQKDNTRSLFVTQSDDEGLVRCKQFRTKTADDIYPDIIEMKEDDKKKDNIECFHSKSNSLPDISEESPIPGKCIFFHETSCNSYSKGKIAIDSRQACAVESAARLNPNLDVYLLYSSPGVLNFDECDESDLFLQALLTYKNVKIMHLDYYKYVKDTPVESLYTSGKVEKSLHAVAHAADIIRYLTLWKYGGIYLDLDVVVMKSLEQIKPNFAGIESDEGVAAGVLSFEATGDGHKWAESCLEDLRQGFTGKQWSNSSVGVITRLLQSVCGVRTVEEMLSQECQNYKIFRQNMFYAIPYGAWRWFFSEDKLDYVLKETRNSYAVHMWNKLSHNTKINVRAKNIPYIYFAEKFCPKVFGACGDFF